MSLRVRALMPVLAAALAGCAAPPTLNDLAEQYVRLVLAVGVHDPDYVDAYYGPPAWRDSARADSLPLDVLMQRAIDLVAAIEAQPISAADSAADSLLARRWSWLRRQTQSVAYRVGMLRGNRPGFDEEAVALYDAAPPRYLPEHFDSLLAQLDAALPRGRGSVSQRLEQWRQRFVIPPARVDTVFRRALAACRARTAAYLPLPPEETFTLEYVTDQPWSAYNWYQGSFASRIQVNTDLPIFIDRAVDLACHEGYPGHHVFNVLLEQALVRGRGWVEYSVYPLHSPQSLIAEGTGNYGIVMAFPGEARVAFERDTLFALAGLDGRQAAAYYRIMDLAQALSYAGNEAARGLLDGRLPADSAQWWLEHYALMSPERARQRVRFIERYRAYVINYNLGRDLVAARVEAAGDDALARWRVFEALLSSPTLPSGL